MNMSNKECNPDVDVEFGKVVIASHVLHKLSELNCHEHRDESNLFSHFFRHQESQFESLWKAPLQLEKRHAAVGGTAVSGHIDPDVKADEGRMEINNIVENQDDSHGDVMDTQNPMMDLVCSLDEQTATCEQLSGVSDQQLMSVLCRLSDAGLCHVCSLLCSMSPSEQSRLGSLVCRHLLLPKLQRKNEESHNRNVVKAVIEFTKTFPHLSCTEVLLPLMLCSQDDTLLQIVSEALSPEHRDSLLRNFLDHEPSKIEEWQIPLIESMLSTSCEDLVKRQLVQLLSSSADDLARNNQFAKLLVNVIKQLGPGAPADVIHQLTAIVSANKSVLKRAAEKALNA
ncbi:hypothetical protein L9F63_016292, partial [Diploptera punctata]